MGARKIAVTVGIFLLVAVGIGSWQWWRWQHPQLLLDPNAIIDENRTYDLEIWVEIGDGLVVAPPLDDRIWSEIITAFQSTYPNTQVFFKPIERVNLPQAMKTALGQGRPPHILLESSEWFAPWSDLQLPIDRFLPPEARDNYFQGALAKVTLQEGTMAWPSLVMPRVWVANGQMWNRLGAAAPSHGLSIGEGLTWTDASWRDLKEGLKTIKLPQPAIALQKGSPDTLVQILVAASKGLVSSTGELLVTEALIQDVLNEYQAQQEDKFISLVQGTLLTDFLSGRRGIIGPVGIWFWSLGENAKGRGYRSVKIPEDTVLVPAPGGAGQGGYLGGSMVQVAVFRHRRFQGQAHARLTMELARELSGKIALEMGRQRLGVPADKTLIDEWRVATELDIGQRENLMAVLESAVGLEPLPLKWHGARRRLIEEILEPVLDDYVNGRSAGELIGGNLPENLPGKLIQAMERLLEGVRGESPQGKRR
ncbi:MAG: hypothetical protein GX986_07450 [Firmicutes bacterium]|nr:hypothetical protein [Bacillota bacterium]